MLVFLRLIDSFIISMFSLLCCGECTILWSYLSPHTVLEIQGLTSGIQTCAAGSFTCGAIPLPLLCYF